jgi:hypothetical protein
MVVDEIVAGDGMSLDIGTAALWLGHLLKQLVCIKAESSVQLMSTAIGATLSVVGFWSTVMTSETAKGVRSCLMQVRLVAGVEAVTVELDWKEASVESNCAATGTRVDFTAPMEVALDLVAEMAGAEVGEEVAVAGSWKVSVEPVM